MMMWVSIYIVANAALVLEPKLVDKTVLDEQVQRIVDGCGSDNWEPLLRVAKYLSPLGALVARKGYQQSRVEVSWR